MNTNEHILQAMREVATSLWWIRFTLGFGVGLMLAELVPRWVRRSNKTTKARA